MTKVAKGKNLIHRKIGGIKLINTGLKGLEIQYDTIEIIDDVSYDSEDSKKSFRPAHRELKALMKEFVKHLIELTGYKNDSVNEAEFEVTGITANSSQFLITGKYKCWKDKIIPVNTPLIKESDQYEHFNDVINLVDNVYKEVDLYLSGAKKITKQEVIMDYMKDVKKDDTFTMEQDFSTMNEEELKLMLKGIDKELGIAVHMEDGQLVIGDAEEEIVPLVSSDIDPEMELPVTIEEHDTDIELDIEL